jgi:MFS family permease
MRHSFRAFRHPNFRLFFAGQSLSVIGTWVQSIAMSWLVYRLSGSPFLLGLTWFASLGPILVLAPFGGLLADRVDRRVLLAVTQTAALLHALAMAVLAYADALGPWGVIGFAALLGVVQACDTPLRQSFLPEMVPDRADLPSAIAFSSFMQQAGRLLGPTIAGFLLAHWSEAFCFAVNGVSKLGVLGAVLVMRVPHRERKPSGRSAGGELAEGLRYAWEIVPIRILLPSVALVSFMAAPYQSLMPIFAAEIYHGDARTLGFLMGAAGLGGVASVLFLASRKDVRGLTRFILGAVGATGTALVAFSFCRWFWLALPLMFVVGSGIIALITASSMIIQTIVDDSKRGRVMSLYTSCFLGMVPMGSLAAGALASAIGAPATLGVGGVCCLLGAMVLWRHLPELRRHIREIYKRLGISAGSA